MAEVVALPLGSSMAARRLRIDLPWVKAVDRGLFCARHFSWLCGVGTGRCQQEFFDLLILIGREGRWQ